MNHALADSLTKFVGEGKSPPTIRFAEYWPSAVSVGYTQKIKEVIDLGECTKLGVDIARRSSPGGAVFLKKDMALSAIIIAPRELLNADVRKNYLELYDRIISALSQLGITATFKRPNDLLVNGKKICGGTQNQTSKAVFVAGTILYDVDKETMSKVLVLDSDINERVTSVKEHSEASKEELLKALVSALAEGKETYFDKISDEEMGFTKELEKKYRSKEWVFMK
jgi:lipoate-protein ligase A